MCYKSLLLLLSVYVTQGEKCVSTNVTLQLQANHLQSRVEGKFEVQCSNADKPMPLCAEVMSRRLIQDLTCSVLGLQHSDYEAKELVTCYSMQYQLNITKGRQAAIACNMITENLQWDNKSFILFHLLIQRNNTTQLEPVTAIEIKVSVYDNLADMFPIVQANVILNISREEREQLTLLLPRKRLNTTTCTACNITKLTASSFTQVVAKDGITRVPTIDIEKAPPVCTTVSNTIERITVVLLLILLISLIIVLASVLVYVGYCRKKFRLHRILRAERAQAMLLSNDYTTDSLANARYVQIEESTSTEGAYDQHRKEAREVGQDHSKEVHYAKVNNCGRQRRQVPVGYLASTTSS